ncbi:MAG: type II toxin-antitoxin system VapC family toxin [Actinomycetota bacterium]|nr:type II toxin-antitoxin system VapC family toxin [Actinomycetota bacterium]
MSAEGDVTYVDSSAIVKLVVAEPESQALRRDLARRRELVTSALSRTEVTRALLPLGPEGLRRGDAVLRTMQLMRVNDRVLSEAGRLQPAELRSLDAIHLATARRLGATLKRIVTYDARMADAARAMGLSVVSPA